MDGNGVLHVTPRVISALDEFSDPRGAFVICGFNDPDNCAGLKIINNIAAGSDYTGFGAVAHTCG